MKLGKAPATPHNMQSWRQASMPLLHGQHGNRPRYNCCQLADAFLQNPEASRECIPDCCGTATAGQRACASLRTFLEQGQQTAWFSSPS